MITMALAATAGAAGVYLLVAAGGRNAPTAGDDSAASHSRRDPERWLRQAGLLDVSVREFLVSSAIVGALTGAAAHMLFGGWVVTAAAAIPATAIPAAAYRERRRRRTALAHRAWPGLIEEVRTLTGAAGRSIPAALFEAGASAPEPLQQGFAAGWREWRVSTDFERTINVLRREFDDPTADATCETLLTAYEIGGTGVDRRLRDLAEDRRRDLDLRAEATARQAGVRFARRFVLIVPAAMALAGSSLGNGRDAFRTQQSQLLIVIALALIAVCWWWSSRLLRLPTEHRAGQP